MLGISELAVILLVIVAVLAVKRLPDLARSSGKAARILKSEAKAMKEESRQGVDGQDRPGQAVYYATEPLPEQQPRPADGQQSRPDPQNPGSRPA